MEDDVTEVTREVIIDLLPAYFSGEASEQTRQLVEGYFEGDPEFARMARHMNDKLLQAVPVELPQNHQMKTLRRAQSATMWRVIALAVVLLFITMVASFFVLVMFVAR
jgi:anti-sigma factor RsiW